MRIIKEWEHNGWGDSISWLNWEARKLVGHLAERPSVGDLVKFEMESGRVYVGTITDVDLPSDPPDMFFADVEDLCFEEGKG